MELDIGKQKLAWMKGVVEVLFSSHRKALHLHQRICLLVPALGFRSETEVSLIDVG
jgi:hypothetical protein